MDEKELKLTYLWRSEEHAVWLGERGPAVRASVHGQEASPGHSLLTDLFDALKQARNPSEYAAGFRARLAEIPAAEDAHPSRRAGWEDADTELLEEARHRQWMTEGREDGFLGTRRLLYDAGHTARENRLPFDEMRTEPWKAGWVAADILIGSEPEF